MNFLKRFKIKITLEQQEELLIADRVSFEKKLLSVKKKILKLLEEKEALEEDKRRLNTLIIRLVNAKKMIKDNC